VLYALNKIVVRHSSIVINDYKLGDSPKLEFHFTIYDMTTYSYIIKGMEYEEETSTLYLPRGVDIHFLEDIFGCDAAMDYKHDPISKVDPILIKCLPRDDTQREALRFILGEGEYSHLKHRSQLGVNLNTGKGKSYVSIGTIAYNSLRSMVIASSIDVLKQWQAYIYEYTDVTEDQIYFITGVATIAKLLNGMKDVNQYKIFLVSHSTIKSYGGKYGWDKVGDLFKFLSVGMKIYDEAHQFFDNICRIDFHTNTRVTLYLTATPARSQEDENDVYKLYFKNVPSIDLFDEDEDPRTQYISLHYNSRPTAQQISDCKNQYGLNRLAYIDYVVDNPNFHKVLHLMMDIIYNVAGKVIVFIGTNSAIERVQAWIVENYPELENSIGIFTSMTKNGKKAELDKKIILTTTKSCGAAIDIPGLKMSIVLAEPFKSEVLARQTLGRTRAKNTLYLEITDEGFFYLKKYYAHKLPIFEKYSTKCSQKKYTDNELTRKAISLVEAREGMVSPITINIKPIPIPKGLINPIRIYGK